MSEHDYPTEEELKRLREWPMEDPRGWLEFAHSIWWCAEWGWPDGVGPGHIHASTGGWSGNEDIIDAMQDNWILWHQTWDTTRRGGHYTFLLPKAPAGVRGDSAEEGAKP